MYYSQSEISFSPDQIPFLFENLYDIKHGNWPNDPRESVKVRTQSSSGAYYESAINIFLELERRLKNYGVDGQIKQSY